MPLYEYECEACGGISEELIRRASDEESLSCRCCGEKRLKKLLSRPAAYSSADCNPAPGGG
jgi:putative FmdB family regulatory protein